MPKPPNKAPIAKLTGPSTALVGEPVTFDGSGSSDPDTGGGQVKSWAFDPGIGESGKSRGNGQPSIFTLPSGYPTAAPYDAVLSVFDKPNQKGSTNSCTLTVTVSAGDPEPPPEPVDCVLGEWRFSSAEPWGLCQPNGTQTRQETWGREIVVPPENGGAACGPQTEQRTGVQSCTYVPPTGDFPVFDALSALPHCVQAVGCRSQAELDARVAQPPAGRPYTDAIGNQYRSGFAYNPTRNAAEFISEPHAFDATSGETTVNMPTTQQVVFPLTGFTDGHRLLITFDWYWDPEVRANYGGTVAWKKDKFFLCNKAWWTMLEDFGTAPKTGDPAVVSTRHDEAGVGMGPEPDPNTSDGVNYPNSPAGTIHLEGLNPAGQGAPNQRPFGAPNGVRCYHSRWQREWIEIVLPVGPEQFTDWNAAYGVTVQPNPNDPSGLGRWYMVSRWLGDPEHGIRRIVFRWPAGGNMQDPAYYPPSITHFKWEHNTSKRNPLGPFSGAGRNLVVLKDYVLPAVPEDDTTIFTLEGL